MEYRDNLDLATLKNILTANEIQNRGYDNLDELINKIKSLQKIASISLQLLMLGVLYNKSVIQKDYYK